MDQCSPCGTSSDYPTHIEVVSLKVCPRDVLGHLESYRISGVDSSRYPFYFFHFFCAAVLNYARDLVRGPQALSFKLQFSMTVTQQEIFSDSDVVPESNQGQGLLKPCNNSS